MRLPPFVLRVFMTARVVAGCYSEDEQPAPIPAASLPSASLTTTPSTLGPELLADQNTRFVTRIDGAVVGLSADGKMLIAGEGSRDFRAIPNAVTPVNPIGLAKSDGGYLMWSEHDVWIGTRSAMRHAPLADFFQTRSAVWIDAAYPTTWVTASDGAFYVRGGAISKVEVNGKPVTFAVADDADHGILLTTSGTYRITVGTQALEAIGPALGRVLDVEHGPGGALYLAGEQGLLVVTGASRRLLTFGGPVRSVSAYPSGALVLVGDQVVQVEEGATGTWTGTALGKVAPETSSVASDTDGNVWVSAPGATNFFPLGKIVSFETDVKPIMTDKCMGCHAKADKAPVLAFDQYAVAQERAASIVDRVKSVDKLMPPPSAGNPLSVEQVRVIVRWSSGGARP